jgi:hypothetical protein
LREPDINIVRIYVEEIQGGLYAWEEETNQFLGQGTTVDALFDRIKEGLPDGMIHVLKCHAERGGKLLHDRGVTEMQQI